MEDEQQRAEERNLIVRRHFESKGYRVHSGLQFGTELVLYADDPSKVHSDFAVHIVPEGGLIDWRALQTLVRSMPGVHKHLIVAHIRQVGQGDYEVDELVFATEHAPFRQKKKKPLIVGAQAKKKQRVVGGGRSESLPPENSYDGLTNSAASS